MESSETSISDDELILLYKKSRRFDRIHILPALAKRYSSNRKIQQIMHEQILSEEERHITIIGIIKSAWLPALYLLDEANKEVVENLSLLLNKWTKEEKELFLGYIKMNQSMSKYITDLCSSDNK
jgi:hypothetical protein